jgi:hypothetical protein
MDDHTILYQLEALADKLGMPVRYEKIEEGLRGAGGLCRVEGKYVMILPSQATVKEKIQFMIHALRKFDFDSVYVKPAIRELLEISEK